MLDQARVVVSREGLAVFVDHTAQLGRVVGGVNLSHLVVRVAQGLKGKKRGTEETQPMTLDKGWTATSKSLKSPSWAFNGSSIFCSYLLQLNTEHCSHSWLTFWTVIITT